jgi:hypothetical protein
LAFFSRTHVSFFLYLGSIEKKHKNKSWKKQQKKIQTKTINHFVIAFSGESFSPFFVFSFLFFLPPKSQIITSMNVLLSFCLNIFVALETV